MEYEAAYGGQGEGGVSDYDGGREYGVRAADCSANTKAGNGYRGLILIIIIIIITTDVRSIGQGGLQWWWVMPRRDERRL